MITKKELENYKKNKIYIKKLENHLLTLIEQTQKVTSTISDTPKGSGSGIQDRIAENIVKGVDLENEIIEYIKIQKEKLLVILLELDKISPKYRNILFDFYIRGYSLVKIAAEEGYSYRHTKRLFKKALTFVKMSPDVS